MTGGKIDQAEARMIRELLIEERSMRCNMLSNHAQACRLKTLEFGKSIGSKRHLFLDEFRRHC